MIQPALPGNILAVDFSIYQLIELLGSPPVQLQLSYSRAKVGHYYTPYSFWRDMASSTSVLLYNLGLHSELGMMRKQAIATQHTILQIPRRCILKQK